MRGKRDAPKCWQTAVAKNPKSAVAEEAMGRYLDENREYPAAESAFKKAIVLDPKWAAAQISLGDFYLARVQSAPALTAYRAAVAASLMPNSARPHVALGNLLSLKGQDDQAISEYQTALKLDPRNAGTYVLLGMAQKKGGNAKLAEKAYRQTLEIEPNNIVALNNLAWIAMMTPERASEAVVYAKKAAEAAPKMGQVLDTLGWAYHAQSRGCRVREFRETRNGLNPARRSCGTSASYIVVTISPTRDGTGNPLFF